MSDNSKIEWTDATWNPIVGCRHVSEGCRNCYAAREASGRLARLPRYKGLAKGGKWVGKTRFAGTRELHKPLHWRRPRRIFVCSMGDLFAHENKMEMFDVLGVIRECPQHQFMILTKRPERISEMLRGLVYPQISLGVSVENQASADKRVPELLRFTEERDVNWKSFVSCEPLLGPIDLSHWLHGTPRLGWVIAGGESGPGARPMHPNWVRRLREQCRETGAPFFFKQWGKWIPWSCCTPKQQKLTRCHAVTKLAGDGKNQDVGFWLALGKKRAGRRLDGREHNAMPDMS